MNRNLKILALNVKWVCPHGTEPSIELQYFSRCCIKVRNLSVVTKLLHDSYKVHVVPSHSWQGMWLWLIISSKYNVLLGSHLSRTTHPNTVVDQVHPTMATILPNDKWNNIVADLCITQYVGLYTRYYWKPSKETSDACYLSLKQSRSPVWLF